MHLKTTVKTLFLLGFVSVLPETLSASVSGKVYQELPVNGSTLNTYGLQDSNEQGLAGITVNLQGSLSSTSTTTSSDGSWQVSTNLGSQIRVTFSDIPAYLAFSHSNNGANSSVQFIADGGTANLGLHDPADYSDTTTPDYITNVQQNGSGINNGNPAIQTVNYADQGLNQLFTNSAGNQGTGPVPRDDTTIQQTGSTWGKAFHKEKQRLFTTAMLQRHIGFAPGTGPGHVFVVDYPAGANANYLGSIDLQGITPVNGGAAIDLGSICRDSGCASDAGNTGEANDYILGDAIDTPNVDLDAFAKVGKISYGDIDLDQATDTLWLVNLKQKGLISMDVSGEFADLPSTVNQYLIESLPNAPSCTGGELRPWALAIHRGHGYLGVVCDAAVSQQAADMTSHVLQFNPNNPTAGFTSVLNIPMNYSRNINTPPSGEWHPWKDLNQDGVSGAWKIYPHPILSDIEFDEHNTLYLSFADRYAMQGGYMNYWPTAGATAVNNPSERVRTIGDIMRACYTNGVFELEGTGSCTQANSADGEFFDDTVGDYEPEGSEGALALLKGSQQLLALMLDPHPQGDFGNTYWYTHGTVTFNTTNGGTDNWYSNMHSSSQTPSGYNATGYNGKGSGMGDIELITPAAPLEIGNRVWLDSNSDGMQDADEPPLSGVQVTLTCGAQTATATTDNNGHYLFKDATASIATWPNGIIPRQSSCELHIDKADAALANNIITSTDAGSNDDVDNDGSESANKIIKTFNTGRSGYNNHSYDFGFKAQNTTVDLELNKTVNQASAQSGDQLSYTLSISNNGPNDATGITVTEYLPSEVTYVSDDGNGTYNSTTQIWTVGNLANGATQTLTIIVSVN